MNCKVGWRQIAHNTATGWLGAGEDQGRTRGGIGEAQERLLGSRVTRTERTGPLCSRKGGPVPWHRGQCEVPR